MSSGAINEDIIWPEDADFKEYRLEIRGDNSGWGGKRLNLFCDKGEQPLDAEPKTLLLLELFASEKAGAVFGHDRIRRALWGPSHSGGDIHQYVTRLRKILNDRTTDHAGKS